MGLAQRKRWSDLPRVVRRLAWWWLVPVAALVLWIVWFKYLGGMRVMVAIGMWSAAVIPLAVNLPIAVPIVVVVRAMRRWKRAYAASGGCLCTACVHDLRGLGDAGVCPECGVPFELGRDRRAWKQAGVASADLVRT